MRVCVGLGNDEARYFNTRHNIGWLLLDYLAEKRKASFSTQALAYIAKTEDFIMVKLKSYMNTSGYHLQQAMNYFKWDVEDLLVVHDDIDFPLGTIKLRFNGGDGGHRGVSSIFYHLGRDDFWRLRLGICGDMHEFENKEHKQDYVVDYVLSPFSKKEIPILKDAFQFLDEHVNHILKDPKKAMNRINRKKLD